MSPITQAAIDAYLRLQDLETYRDNQLVSEINNEITKHDDWKALVPVGEQQIYLDETGQTVF